MDKAIRKAEFESKVKVGSLVSYEYTNGKTELGIVLKARYHPDKIYGWEYLVFFLPFEGPFSFFSDGYFTILVE